MGLARGVLALIRYAVARAARHAASALPEQESVGDLDRHQLPEEQSRRVGGCQTCFFASSTRMRVIFVSQGDPYETRSGSSSIVDFFLALDHTVSGSGPVRQPRGQH